MLAKNVYHCLIATSIPKACFALTLRLCGCEPKTKMKSTAALKIYFVSGHLVFVGLIRDNAKVSRGDLGNLRTCNMDEGPALVGYPVHQTGLA
jgi:hypothetical protein